MESDCVLSYCYLAFLYFSFYHLPFVTLRTYFHIFIAFYILTCKYYYLSAKFYSYTSYLKMISARSKRRIFSLIFILKCASFLCPIYFLPPRLNMRRFISLPDLFPPAPTNCPWVSEDVHTLDNHQNMYEIWSLWNGNQTVPGRTSTRKRKKQRKTTESISEHKKTTLAQSDKASWFDQVKWLEEEESNASVSAWKLCSKSTQRTLQRKETTL